MAGVGFEGFLFLGCCSNFCTGVLVPVIGRPKLQDHRQGREAAGPFLLTVIRWGQNSSC